MGNTGIFRPNLYRIEGDRAFLTVGGAGCPRETVIDAADLGRVLRAGRWRIVGSTSRRKGADVIYPYAALIIRRNYRTTRTLMHRFILSVPEGMEVDHINHDTLDNRRENLRLVSKSENQQNIGGAHRDSKSGVRNVYWQERKQKWMVQICLNYRRVTLGLFDTVDEAAAVAEEARKRYHTHCPENSRA